MDAFKRFMFGYQHDRPGRSRNHTHVGGRSRDPGPDYSRNPTQSYSHQVRPEPMRLWDPAQQQHYQVREVAPGRRPSISRPGVLPRAQGVRFESDRGQVHRANPPAQGRFPFTVFGKGNRNQPDRTNYRGILPCMHGGNSEHGGQQVGTNIMDKYVIISALSKGGMAEAINVVQQKRTGKIFVQKCIPLRNSLDLKCARAEINTLLKIDAHGRHDNLNAIIESEISEARHKCFIILEYCDLGSLHDKITSFRRQRGHPRESSAWNILAGVASGLAFLYQGFSNGRSVRGNWDPICHLDLKPDNIFLSSKGGKYRHARVVLADFGCAITASDVVRHIEQPFFQECGTPAYYPPEARSTGRYGPQMDIWQLGASVHVFCKLLDGPDSRYLALLRPCSGRYSDELNSVVKLLCHPNWKSRPNALEVFRKASVEFEAAARA